jgi:hypothetical protein
LQCGCENSATRSDDGNTVPGHDLMELLIKAHTDWADITFLQPFISVRIKWMFKNNYRALRGEVHLKESCIGQKWPFKCIYHAEYRIR